MHQFQLKTVTLQISWFHPTGISARIKFPLSLSCTTLYFLLERSVWSVSTHFPQFNKCVPIPSHTDILYHKVQVITHRQVTTIIHPRDLQQYSFSIPFSNPFNSVQSYNHSCLNFIILTLLGALVIFAPFTCWRM